MFRTYKRTIKKLKLSSRTVRLAHREAELSLLATQILLAHADPALRPATEAAAGAPGGGTIGLSPGHAFKTGAPGDRGAKCRGGDSEVDPTAALAGLVERRLR